MILKILGPCGWEMIGNVEDFRYFYQNPADPVVKADTSADEHYELKMQEEGNPPGHASECGDLHIIAKRKSGKTVHISTHERNVFVLNEEGKTIERI